jgi:hypothetical protein
MGEIGAIIFMSRKSFDPRHCALVIHLHEKLSKRELDRKKYGAFIVVPPRASITIYDKNKTENSILVTKKNKVIGLCYLYSALVILCCYT